MGITAPSTASDDQNRARRLPPDLLHRTNTLLDELERLRASKPDDAYARDCKTQQKESLVLHALENATLLAAIMSVSPCFRATKVRDHLIHYKDRYNILKPPTRDTIKAVLTKHGYMF